MCMNAKLTEKAVVEAFWQAMQSNDFSNAGEWLSETVVCEWVLSNERIVGRENFVAINQQYPTNARWEFTLKRIVAEGNQVVTDVDVTDGRQNATAITFHTVENGLITHQTEYWPDYYQAPQWRRQWVKPMISDE